MRPHCRDAIAALFLVWFCAAPASAQLDGGPPPDEPDWSKVVPGDVRFYLELHDLAGMRTQLRKLGIWRTVRELAEQDVPQTTTKPWQQRTADLLGLTPDAAVNLVIGRRTALFSVDSARWQDGVLMAELGRASDLVPLLRRWRARAQPDEGAVRRWSLHGGILLAALDRTVVFGPAGDPDGLWGRTVLLLSGRRGPTLAGRSEFAGLRARLSEDHQGMIYAVWPEGDPTAVGGCKRLLAGFTTTAGGLTCELRGHRTTGQATRPLPPAHGLRTLPQDTLAVWQGSFDFAAVQRDLRSDWGRRIDPLAGLFLMAFTGHESSNALLTKLGPRCTVAVAKDPTVHATGFALPAVTVLIEAQDGKAHIERLDMMGDFLAGVFIALTTTPGQKRVPVEIIRKECEDVELHAVDMGPALAKRTGLDFLKGIQPGWALLDGDVVVSTSAAHLEEVIRARRGKARSLGDDPDLGDLLPPQDGDAPIASCWFFRGGNLAALFSNWLRFVQKEHPAAMKQQWWKDWATTRVKLQTRLGLGLARAADGARRAIVREVEPGSPAAGILLAGDVIVAAAGSALTTTQPAEEVARRYHKRGAARTFQLDVLRNGAPMTFQIPVSPEPTSDARDFHPIQSLRQLITLSRRVKTATIAQFATQPDRFDVRITIRWVEMH